MYLVMQVDPFENQPTHGLNRTVWSFSYIACHPRICEVRAVPHRRVAETSFTWFSGKSFLLDSSAEISYIWEEGCLFPIARYSFKIGTCWRQSKFVLIYMPFSYVNLIFVSFNIYLEYLKKL